MLPWALLALLALVVGLLWWRGRREQAQESAAWDALARALSLGFDPGSRSIRGKYRLLRLEITAPRRLLGLGRRRTEILAEYEGVVPAGLALAVDARGLRASAREPETLAQWLDAQQRRALLPPMLTGGVQVSGNTLQVGRPGLLADPEALRTVLAQLAELAKLLSIR